MLPEALADLLYHYHMNNMYTCDHSTCKRGLFSAHFIRFSGPFIMEFVGCTTGGFLVFIRIENSQYSFYI